MPKLCFSRKSKDEGLSVKANVGWFKEVGRAKEIGNQALEGLSAGPVQGTWPHFVPGHTAFTTKVI